jgi:hypothetical protein
MTIARNIAVVVRDRQNEAMRMALGLILVDDRVDVFLLAGKLGRSPQDVQNLELMKEMGITVYSSDKKNVDAEYLPAEEIARRLLQYDHILPY